jgi:hypothetical protein
MGQWIEARVIVYFANSTITSDDALYVRNKLALYHDVCKTGA